MSDEEIRIAVAKSVGTLGAFYCPDCRHEVHPDNVVSRGNVKFHGQRDCGVPLHQQSPDYPNDLNAMHEVEKTLTNFEYSTYVDTLQRIISVETQSRIPKFPQGILLKYMEESSESATARQRAEAYLRTKALWKDEVK